MSLDSFRSIFCIGIFGLIGVLLRYAVVQMVLPRSPDFPAGTLIVNLVGSFLIGAFWSLAVLKNLISAPYHQSLVVGLLGGFTTFSSFSMEVLSLFQAGQWASGFLYGFGSPILGVCCAYLGFLVGRI